jgi:hypothetical protein
MPLIKGKSKKAFGKNVANEMEVGKPQKQALAIAYSVKRKANAKKMAKGGMAHQDDCKCAMCSGGKAMMAEGGNVDIDENGHPVTKFPTGKPDYDASRDHGLDVPRDISEDESYNMDNESDSVADRIRRKSPMTRGMYADGGMATTKELYDMDASGDPDEAKDSYPNEFDGAPLNYQIDDSMPNKVLRKRMAHGGPVGTDGMHTDAENYLASTDHGMDLAKDGDENQDYNMANQSMSIADRIRRKSPMTPHMMADGGTVEIDDDGYTRPGRDEGGSVHEHDDGRSDILMNGAPQPRVYQQRNHAMMKENFNKPIDDASYPAVKRVSQDDLLDENNEDDGTVMDKIKRKIRNYRM